MKAQTYKIWFTEKSADSELKIVLPKTMDYFCWEHQGGSHLNVKGITSCWDYINNL